MSVQNSSNSARRAVAASFRWWSYLYETGIKPVVQLQTSKMTFQRWQSRDHFPRRVTCYSLVRGLSGCTSSAFSLFCSHFHPLNSPLFTPLNDPQRPFLLISSGHVLSLTPQLNQQLLHNIATLKTCHRFVDYCCYCTLYTQTGLCTWKTCDVIFITSCLTPTANLKSPVIASILRRQWSEVIYF